MGLKSRQKRERWREVDSWLSGKRVHSDGVIDVCRRYPQRVERHIRRVMLEVRRIAHKMKYPPADMPLIQPEDQERVQTCLRSIAHILTF